MLDEAFFDEGLNRVGSDCIKWDACRREHGKNTLPMWVADMDFKSPPEVTRAIVERAQHPTYGYTEVTGADHEALCAFWKRRHGLDVAHEDVVMLPCVVTGMKIALQALTEPGDAVIYQPPVYGPFSMSVESTGRSAMEAPLKRDEKGYYTMDLEAVEQCCRNGAKLMLLCSPHNPVGRCWTREELTALVDVLRKYQVILVSDEIHADFVFAPSVFTPTLSLGYDRTVSLAAASKTFNLAGLQQSVCLCPNPKLREKLNQAVNATGVTTGNIFALTATRAAYTYGDEWLDGLIAYLAGNIREMEACTAELLPRAVLTPMEATYLAWLDLRAWGLSTEEIMARCEKTGVAFTGGTFFSKELGDGFVRVNLGCPRRHIREAMERLKAALD